MNDFKQITFSEKQQTSSDSKYYRVSIKEAVKSKALNGKLIFVSMLISMFTSAFMFILSEIVISVILGLEYTFLGFEGRALIMMIPVFLGIGLIFLGVNFLNSLLNVYKIEGNNLIIGTIQYESAAKGLTRIINAINCNMDPYSVKASFDTDLYKKEIYENAVLESENKKFVTYKCNDKYVTLPKIYRDCDADDGEYGFLPLIKPVMKQVAVITVIVGVILFSDIPLTYAFDTQSKGEELTEEKMDSYLNELNEYGWETSVSKYVVILSKETSEDTESKVELKYDSQDRLCSIDMLLYYDSSNYDIEQIKDELKVILKELPYWIKNGEDIDKVIDEICNFIVTDEKDLNMHGVSLTEDGKCKIYIEFNSDNTFNIRCYLNDRK